MSPFSNHDHNPPDESNGSLVGLDLINWIAESADFSLAEAHSINRKSWSDETSQRFNRFKLNTETGGIKAFFEDPWSTPKGPLLDIACTTGHNLAFFAERGIHPLFGIDISLPFLNLAKRRLRNACIQQADMVALPFQSNYFNTVIARGIFHNTTTQGFLKALNEVHRVLHDDGILFFRRRYRPTSFDGLKRFALYTYLEFDKEQPMESGGKPTCVRNFIPLPQIKSIIENVGFRIIGDPPIKTVEHINNQNKRRYSIECVCVKQKNKFVNF